MIHNDRLEITSPGGLMPGVTIERMKEGYSKIRNRALDHAFSYMNLIEGWGTGILRLLREMKEYGLAEPEFTDMEIALRINLYRSADIAQDNVQNASKDNSKTQYNAHEMREDKKVRDKCAISALNRELSAQEKTILEFINENGSITSSAGFNRMKYY